jgi:tetratricopeptide (TPR) repeat protein
VYYLMGAARYQAKDVAGAIQNMRQALAIPSYLTPWDAHLYLGGILLDQGKVDDAITEIRKAIDVQPEFGEAHNALGYALLLKQRNEEAVEALSRAVRFAPTLVAAHRNLGLAYVQMGKKEDARASFRKVVELAPPESSMVAEARKQLDDLGGDGASPAGAAPPKPAAAPPAGPSGVASPGNK